MTVAVAVISSSAHNSALNLSMFSGHNPAALNPLMALCMLAEATYAVLKICMISWWVMARPLFASNHQVVEACVCSEAGR